MTSSGKNIGPLVLIMAGGSGTRFWPFSRRKKPKQLLPIYSNKTLLAETIIRAETVTSGDRVFIGTGPSLKKAILESHTGIDSKNFVVEPEARNTAPIIALAALTFLDRFGDIPFVVLSADHYISPLSLFKRSIKTAVKLAESGHLVTLGIKPTRPDTGYGYLLRGKAIAKTGGYALEQFVEKPDEKTAKKYVRNKRYFWNAGIFIWKPSTLLDQMRIHCPDVIGPLEKYFPFRKAGDLRKAFAASTAESIDYALMEKAENVALVETEFHWDDVGSWLALERFTEPDDDGNVGRGSRVFGFQSKNNLVNSSKQMVCLLGMEDTVVIEDGDVLFVAKKDKLDEIKPMLKKMDGTGWLRKYL